ncbi:hypothetical protein JZ785_09665 [Alicyclobacillus curvatus]|nr:hypothetical protein JZ785_09665 [Alicyclobacillus curvatus]
MINRILLAGCSLALLYGVIYGYDGSSTSVTISNESGSTVTVRTDRHGFPIQPYVYKDVETDIIPFISMNHVTNAFGYPGKAIEGKDNTKWLRLSLVEQALNGAGISTTLTNQTLNLKVPPSISIRPFTTATNSPASSQELTVDINGEPVAYIPWMKTDNSAHSYVPDTQLMKALGPVDIQMHWGVQAGSNLETLYIGSPLYGLVTTVTTFDGGHGSRTSSSMSIVRADNNWIPYDYIMNSLGNAQDDIQVSMLGGGFSGIDITVPSTIPVDMTNLPSQSSPHTGEVPIEINHQVVAYAQSMVPKFGPSTGYLSSTQVMGAIKRIGISMHWNNTDGTFTQWNITAKTIK